MKHRINLNARSAVAAALLCITVGSAAAADNALPEFQQSGAVRYVSGGVGEQESHAFLEHRQEHPLSVEVYAREGAREVYTAGTSIRVSKPSGAPVLDAEAQGPFLLADLPPGRYTVEVTLQGETMSKSVTVGRGRTSRAIFVFPEPRA